MRGTFIYLWLLVFSYFALGCSAPFAVPGRTVLAPIPLALAYGVNRDVLDLKNHELHETVPVFICSSRNLEPHGDKVDPFGNQRSKKLVPYLALAQVSIGRNTSESVIMNETLNLIEQNKTRVKVESFEMFESPNVTPFS